MQYSASARLVLNTIQKARAAHDDQPRFTHAIRDLMDLSPADSSIARALLDDSVWSSTMRDQLRRYFRDTAHNLGPRFDVGLRADQLVERGDDNAKSENALVVTEFHLARALVDMAGNVFQELGIRADAFVRRVREVEGQPVESLCFVLMPFRADLKEVYTSALRPAIEAAGLRCERADDIDHPGVILDQIDERIQKAFAIVADLTSLNPNVMQEIGYARCSRKPIVLLTQDQTSGLPFDVHHYRVIRYVQSEPGLAELRTRPTKILIDLRQGRKPEDRAVEEEPLRVSLQWFEQNIEPGVRAEGYEIIKPTHATADERRLEGWEDIVITDREGKSRRVQTKDLTPLRKKKA